MTQPPDDQQGRPPDPSAAGPNQPPVSAPPPSTWHFPAEPVPPPAPVPGPQPNGSQAPYGTSPHYGTPQHDGGLPRYAGPAAQGGPAPRYGTPYGSGSAARQGWPPGQEAELAEWWRRLLARLIDLAVIGVVLLPVTIAMLSRPYGKLEQVTNHYPSLNTPAAQSAFGNAEGKFLVAVGTLGLIAAVVWFCYDSVQHARWGQTLGKRVLSTRVVSARDGSPIDGPVAVRRAAVYALIPVFPLVGTFFALLNGLWLFWDRRRQCLHDKAASTIVVKNARATSPSRNG